MQESSDKEQVLCRMEKEIGEREMAVMRLDKFLTQTKAMSRSEAKLCLKKGRVTVDGTVEKRGERKISAETSLVCLDNQVCRYEPFQYIMLNKPQGVISATEDSRERTVLDLLEPSHRELFPVGRLDKDTEGLLLLTNDGILAHALLSPKRHVDKCYYALLDGPVGKKEQEMFEEGLEIGEKKTTLPAKLQIAKWEEKTENFLFPVYITIQEGRFHQVKRMARAVGRKVVFLKRLSMGTLSLDPSLKPGEFRPLTGEEVEGLRKIIKKDGHSFVNGL